MVLAARKAEYIQGLTSFRSGYVNAWLTMFGVATARAAILAQRYLDAVVALARGLLDLIAAMDSGGEGLP